MDVLLINAPVARYSPHAGLSPPLGLAYVASALILEGYKIRAIDFNLGGMRYTMEDRMATLGHPRIVGISAHTETYPQALNLARRVKAVKRDIQVVMGGPHPSLLPEQVLQSDAVDFVVIGQGEKTMVELVNYLDQGRGRTAEIQGLAYRRGREIMINEPRVLSDTGGSFYPARELFPLAFYPNPFSVLTARGSCPFRCPFCSGSALWHGRRKARSPEEIMDEINMLRRRHGAQAIFFSDDLFTLDREWTYELLHLLHGLDVPMAWGCATRVDLVDDHLLSAMAGAGCRSIQYGIESGSQKILDSVKGIQKGQALKAVKAARGAGLKVSSSFMIPFPEDTGETLSESIAFMEELHREGSRILLSYTTPYPGTYFYQQAEALGIKILAEGWEEFDAKHNIMETKYLSGEEIEGFVNTLIQKLHNIRPYFY